MATGLPKAKIVVVNAPCLSGQTAACTSGLSAALKANSNVVAVLGTGGIDAPTAAGLKQAQHAKFLVAGLALSAPVLAGIKNGSILCTVSPEQYLEGYVAAQLLINALNSGKPLITGWFDMPSLVVDSSLVGVIATRQASDATMRAWLHPEILRIFANTSPYMKPLSAGH